jgi:hypothetical protein
VPETVGGELTVGGLPGTGLVGDDVLCADPAAFVAVTTMRMVDFTSADVSV